MSARGGFALLLALCLGGAADALATQGATATPPGPAGPPGAVAEETDPMSDLARLDWSLTPEKSGSALHVAYTITNTSSDNLFIADLLPVAGKGGFVLGQDFIIVVNGDSPDTVRLVRGRVPSLAPLPLDPGARGLRPGESATGEAVVPLPLRAQHYHGGVEPLVGEPTKAVLEIGLLTADARWVSLPLATGGSLTTSSPGDTMRFARGAVLDLPLP